MRQHGRLGARIEHRVQQLVERVGLDAADRLLATDDALLDKRHRDLQRRLRGALPRPGLQHPQFAALDGELDVLHVAVFVFEDAAHLEQFAEHRRHDLFHRRQFGVARLFAGDRQMLRRADAGDDILALRVDEVFAVELVGAGRRIAGERDAGRAILAHIAEHHRLDVDRGAPLGGDIVQPAVGHGAGVVPRAEHGGDGTPQLLVRVLRERLAGLALDDLLEAGGERLPILGAELGVENRANLDLMVLDQLLEMVMLDAEHDLPVHLQKAAVAVIREALVATVFGETVDGVVVETEIEHGVHHARHRGARARAHRHKERLFRIAEFGADRCLDIGERGGDLFLQIGRIAVVMRVEIGADLGRDREAGRHRQAKIGHFGETRTLAAEQIAQIALPLGGAAAKTVDPFRHGFPHPSIWEKSAT